MRHERTWNVPLLRAEAGMRRSAHRLPCDERVALGWRRLEADCSLPSQTLAFHAALADAMMTGRVLRIVTVGDGEHVSAILPLCRRRGWLARWHAAGVRQVYEPVDALCASDSAASQLAARLARFSRPVRLDRIPASSPLVPALGKAMKGRGIVVARPAQDCPRIAFTPDETNPEMRFNAGRRSDFRRARRRAEALGDVTFEIHEPDAETFAELYDTAVAAEQRGWKGQSGTALGCDPVKGAFFRDFLLRCSLDGACRIAFMRIGGRVAAMHLAVVFANRYWLFKIGFDEDFARCSPGSLLMLHVMADAMERGLEGIEMLGEVEPWITETWTRDATPCIRLQTYPFNPAGIGLLAFEAALWGWTRLSEWAGLAFAA